MADYYPLLAKAVSGLPNSTPEARQAVYERARRALYGQLRNLDPPVPEDAIEREAQSLERAVAQIETELTARFSPERDKIPSGTDYGLGSPAGPVAPPREPRRPLPSASTPPGTDMPGPAAKRTLTSPLPPRTPIKVRRDPPGAAPSAWPIRPPRPGSAANLAGPLPPSGPGDPPAPFSAPKPPSSREGTQGLAPVRPPIGEETSGPGNAPFVETLAPEAIGPSDGSYEPSSTMRLEAQHPFAPHAERDRSAAKRVGIVVGIVGLVVVLVAAAAYRLRDRPEDLVRLQPSAMVQGETAPGGKIVDRIDTGTATPGSPRQHPRPGNAARPRKLALNPAIPPFRSPGAPHC